VAAAGVTTAAVLDGPLLGVLAPAGVQHVLLGAYRPAVSALLPVLVRRPEELLACTAAFGLLDGVTFLAGPLVAGLLLAAAGPGVVLCATVVLLAAAMLTCARLAGPAPASSPVRAERAAAARALRHARGPGDHRACLGADVRSGRALGARRDPRDRGPGPGR
jgi:hypothetical protein